VRIPERVGKRHPQLPGCGLPTQLDDQVTDAYPGHPGREQTHEVGDRHRGQSDLGCHVECLCGRVVRHE
jgi:hypothetical protein